MFNSDVELPEDKEDHLGRFSNPHHFQLGFPTSTGTRLPSMTLWGLDSTISADPGYYNRELYDTLHYITMLYTVLLVVYLPL